MAETNLTGERPFHTRIHKSPGHNAEAQHPTTQTGEGSYIFLSVYIEFVFSKMQTTPRIGFWLDNSNQTPQQTVETILNVRKPV
ncbi:putative phosphotransferase [Bifidobacterium reuteri DSM 23975]|uniref:Putative phosphotransferase n=1 Tax=Bifidobacterium reuteri DSM 23975 TaxID=1437610 RepID=A0A087CHF0_9BIFI|nr:putative phosphotransferase [Bifidobacterium reuteri DSM 23975]